MKKGTKITLIVLASILAFGIIVFVCADVVISRLAMKEVNKALSALPPEYGEASCGDIHVRLFSGTASVMDLHFYYRGESVSKKDSTARPGIDIHVERIDVGRFFYAALFNHRILVSDLNIVRPSAELWLDDKNPETCFPQIPKDKKLDSVKHANPFLERADLLHARINHATFKMHSLRTKLDMDADSISLKVNNLAYDFCDSTFHYNDSVYRFSLEHAAIIFPDGRMGMEVNDIAHRDQGEFKLGYTRIYNTMNRWKLGDIVKEPVTWMDMKLESVEIAPFNPIRKALAQDYTLDNIKAVVSHMDVFRDTRYPPVRPFPMPQEAIMAIPVPLLIKTVNADIKLIDVELASTKTNCGKLKLKNIHADVKNISNRKGAKLVASGTCPVEKGKANASFSMTMNKACEFGLDIHATNIDIAFLNPFLRPLIGITMDCHLDTLDTHYTGDDVTSKGTFRMLYHGFDAKVHKEDDVPFKVITKNAGIINSVANSLLPKSNPTSVDIRPREYYVEWKRDIWSPFPLYLFGACINGAMKTFLPGLFVHEQVSSKVQQKERAKEKADEKALKKQK